MVSFTFKGENHCIPMTIPCSVNTTDYTTVETLIRDAYLYNLIVVSLVICHLITKSNIYSL